MATLNQAKIIKALEKMVTAPNDDFIFPFSQPTELQTRRSSVFRWEIHSVMQPKQMVILPSPIRCTFILLQMVPPLKRLFEDTLALPVIEQRKIRFILVTDYTTVIAYDRTVKDQTTFDYSDFKTNYEFFLPLTGLCEKAIAYSEHPADTKPVRRWDGCMTISRSSIVMKIMMKNIR